MTQHHPYDEAHALFVALSERSAEFSDDQHICVMEASNAFLDVRHRPPSAAPTPVAATGMDLMRLTADALARLIGETANGTSSLQYARARALLMSSLAS